MLPNAAGAATATVLVGAGAPEDGAGTMAAAAAGEVPVVVCAAPVVEAGTPISEPSGVRLVGAAEGVADAVDVAANALPDGVKDAAAGDTGVPCAGCDPVALKDVPVDAGAAAVATVGADAKGCAVAGPEALAADVRTEAAAAALGSAAKGGAVVRPEAPVTGMGAEVAAAAVRADAAGCAANGAEAPVEGIRAGVVGAGAGVTVLDAGSVASSDDAAAAGTRMLEPYAVPVTLTGVDGATGVADAAGRDSEPAAGFVTPVNAGVAATGALFRVFAGVGVAEPGAPPTGDDASAVEVVCTAAKGSADNGFDHDAEEAAASTDAGSMTAALAATGSPVSDSGTAIGLACDAPSPETGGLTMSSHGAKSIGASNAGATDASAPCRCSPSA